MGLKYVEIVKSIVLTLLILLSITLTFLIWTYTPHYETIDQLSTVDISIADKKKIEEIVKPYKVVFHYDNQLTGSFEEKDLSYIAKEMKKWTIVEIELADSDFEDEKLSTLLRRPNTLTLYYQGEVPLPVYEAIVEIDNQNIPEASFDRLIIDWGENDKTPVVYFVSQVNGLLYKGLLRLADSQHFQHAIVEWGQALLSYTEISLSDSHFIAVPAERFETIQSSYYEEEIEPTRFRDALFADPNAVRRSQVSAVHQEFGDDHALMSIDTESKMLSYVLPAAESDELAIPSDLLLNTIDFVNEHGGWTDEFRFAYMNPISRYVKFHLYVNGLPVFSDDPGATEIAQIWGENRNFRYIRPYYSLNVPLPEMESVQLQSGPEAAKVLIDSMKVDFSVVEELVPGYQLKYDKERKLVTLEPSWFYLIKGNWVRVSSELLGGDSIGLE